MKYVALLFASLTVLYLVVQEDVVTYGPGVLAPDAPAQVDTPRVLSFTKGEYTISPLANFEITARILSRRNYGWDRQSDLSPIDLALGWGFMSDEAVFEKMTIRQSGRWYFWKFSDLPYKKSEISSHSANMHMIPANSEVEEQLKGLKKGEVIELSGKLVRVNTPDGWRWNSSLSRTDTGAGSCELIWVESVHVVEIL